MTVTKIKASIFSGLKWNTISVLGTRGTDFIVKLILARLVLPEAYGIIGMAMVLIGFLQIVSDMGLFNALVQKKEDENTQVLYSSAFWFLGILASCFVAFFFLFISPLGASFYNEPRLVPVLNALSFYLFFNVLSIVPRVILTKKLDFKNLVKITFTGTILSSVTAIILAFIGFGVWSLVTKALLGSFVVFLSYWLRVGWRPQFILKLSALTKLAGYSTYTQFNAMLFYFRSNLDYLIVGKLLASHVLGVYTLAFTLSEILRAQLYSIFNKIFFPVYSKLQDDLEQIKHYYLKVMTLTATVSFPVSIVFIGLAEEIITLLFGIKWIEAASPLRILSVASIIFAISGTPAEVLKGIGKPSVSFYLNTINTFVIALPLMYFGIKYYGLDGVAYAVCIHYTTSRLAFHYYMKKYINVTDMEVLQALSKPILAGIVMLGIIYGVDQLQLSMLFTVVLGVGIGGLAYALFFVNEFKYGFKSLIKS